MLWFFIGFIFGCYIAQESPQFPNIKTTALKVRDFIKDIIYNEKTTTFTAERRARAKSE